MLMDRARRAVFFVTVIASGVALANGILHEEAGGILCSIHEIRISNVLISW
jgi:hypothetical protein